MTAKDLGTSARCLAHGIAKLVAEALRFFAAWGFAFRDTEISSMQQQQQDLTSCSQAELLDRYIEGLRMDIVYSIWHFAKLASL